MLDIMHTQEMLVHTSAGVPGILYQELFISRSGYTQNCHAKFSDYLTQAMAQSGS